MDGGAWWAAVHGVARSWTQLSDFTFTFHFHAQEKEMATHSSVLAWRIPGTGEPGGLPSVGSHRVGHDWSDLAAAAVIIETEDFFICVSLFIQVVSFINIADLWMVQIWTACTGPLICRFFSTVNTAVQQKLQLVGPCSTEVLKIWRAYHIGGFSNCLEGWHVYLPCCSRVRKMLHVESQPQCYRTEFLKLGTVDILSQIILHCWGLFCAFVGDLATSLASPYQVLAGSLVMATKNISRHHQKTLVVLSFPRHCQISRTLAETHWSIESGLGARSPTSVGQFTLLILCVCT